MVTASVDITIILRNFSTLISLIFPDSSLFYLESIYLTIRPSPYHSVLYTHLHIANQCTYLDTWIWAHYIPNVLVFQKLISYILQGSSDGLAAVAGLCGFALASKGYSLLGCLCWLFFERWFLNCGSAALFNLFLCPFWTTLDL